MASIAAKVTRRLTPVFLKRHTGDTDKAKNDAFSRARKALERKHALEIAWKHASTCYDLDSEGNYVLASDPLAVKTLFDVFHKHLLGKDAITYKQLQNEQSLAFMWLTHPS